MTDENVDRNKLKCQTFPQYTKTYQKDKRTLPKRYGANPPLPDLEVFEALCIDLVNEEIRQLFAQLVEAEEKTLHVAELQLGLLAHRVLAVLTLRLWGKRHELLDTGRKGLISSSFTSQDQSRTTRTTANIDRYTRAPHGC